jgi:hypothetical protein
MPSKFNFTTPGNRFISPHQEFLAQVGLFNLPWCYDSSPLAGVGLRLLSYQLHKALLDKRIYVPFLGNWQDVIYRTVNEDFLLYEFNSSLAKILHEWAVMGKNLEFVLSAYDHNPYNEALVRVLVGRYGYNNKLRHTAGEWRFKLSKDKLSRGEVSNYRLTLPEVRAEQLIFVDSFAEIEEPELGLCYLESFTDFSSKLTAASQRKESELKSLAATISAALECGKFRAVAVSNFASDNFLSLMQLLDGKHEKVELHLTALPPKNSARRHEQQESSGKAAKKDTGCIALFQILG